MSTAAQRDGRAPIAVVRTLRFAGSGFAAAGLCAAYPSEHRCGCSPYGERTNQIGASAFHLLLVHILQIRIPVQPLFVRLQQPPRFLVPPPPFPQRGFHVPPQTAHQRVGRKLHGVEHLALQVDERPLGVGGDGAPAFGDDGSRTACIGGLLIP